MSDSENEYKSEDEIETEEMPKPEEKKVRKARKPLDEEAKKKMLANLEKGRKKAQETKRLRALEKSKAIQDKMKNELIEADKSVKKNKQEPQNAVDDIEENIKVKKEKPVKEKKKSKKQKIILQVDSDSSSDEEAIIIKTRTKKRNKKEEILQQIPKPQLIRTPTQQAPPTPRPELTTQQKALIEKNRKIELAVNGMKSRRY